MHYRIHKQHHNVTRLPLTQFPTALFYGYGVYTSFKTPIEDHALRTHLLRLSQDALALGMDIGDLDLRGVLLPDRTYRVTVAPQVNHFSQIIDHWDLNPIIILSEFESAPVSAEPLALMSITRARSLTSVKHSSLAQALLDKRLAKSQGFDDVLYFTPDGLVTESSTANVVIREGDHYLTPAAECLPGITRQQFQPEAAEIDRERLLKADGVFLTNAVQGARPVCRLDTDQVATSSWKTLQLEETTPGSSLS